MILILILVQTFLRFSFKQFLQILVSWFSQPLCLKRLLREKETVFFSPRVDSYWQKHFFCVDGDKVQRNKNCYISLGLLIQFFSV